MKRKKTLRRRSLKNRPLRKRTLKKRRTLKRRRRTKLTRKKGGAGAVMDADEINDILKNGELHTNELIESDKVSISNALNTLKDGYDWEKEKYGHIIMDAMTKDPALTDENLTVFLKTVGNRVILRNVLLGRGVVARRRDKPNARYTLAPLSGETLGTRPLSLTDILDHPECCRSGLRDDRRREHVKQLLTKIQGKDESACIIS